MLHERWVCFQADIMLMAAQALPTWMFIPLIPYMRKLNDQMREINRKIEEENDILEAEIASVRAENTRLKAEADTPEKVNARLIARL